MVMESMEKVGTRCMLCTQRVGGYPQSNYIRAALETRNRPSALNERGVGGVKMRVKIVDDDGQNEAE